LNDYPDAASATQSSASRVGVVDPQVQDVDPALAANIKDGYSRFAYRTRHGATQQLSCPAARVVESEQLALSC